MTRISKEQTVRYVLTAVDDLLTEDPQRTQLFSDTNNKKRMSPWVGFMNMLNRDDRFIVHQVGLCFMFVKLRKGSFTMCSCKVLYCAVLRLVWVKISATVLA